MLKVDVKPMRTLTKKTRGIICKCPEQCKNYVHIEDYGRFCEGASIEFAYTLLRLLKGGFPRITTNDSRGWTLKELQFLVNWCNKGLKYGDRKLIAEMLDRSERSISSKIDELRKDGVV